MSTPAIPLTETPDVEPYADKMRKQLAIKKNRPEVVETPEINSLINLAKQQNATDVLRANEALDAPTPTPASEPTPKDDILSELENLEVAEPSSVSSVPPIEDEKPKPTRNKEFNFRQLEEKVKLAEEKALALQHKYDALELSFEKTSFEKSPKFQAKFLKPKEEAIQKVKGFVKELEIDNKVISESLELKGAARLKYIDDNFESPTAAVEFLHLINEIDNRQTLADNALNDSKSTQLEIAEEEVLSKAKEAEITEENFRGISKQIASSLSLFRERDGDEEHNNAVKKRIELARKITTGEASTKDILAAPFLAVVARDYIRECAQLREELQSYKSRIREDNSMEPRISEHTRANTSLKPSKPKGAMQSISERLHK